MSTPDACCSLVPYFRVAPGKLPEFKALVARFLERTRNEPKCMHYAFSFEGDIAHCREGYDDAEGLLAHLENIGPILQEALQIAEVLRLEIHAPAAEIEKLREPLADLMPQFFVLEPGGFRR
jgi:quinol monooxygenase YgiN